MRKSSAAHVTVHEAGALLRTLDLGGAISSGPAVVNDMVYVGAGTGTGVGTGSSSRGCTVSRSSARERRRRPRPAPPLQKAKP